jgi:hypothetical protein
LPFQHTTLLGQFSRTSLSEGVNERLHWRDDNTRLAVTVSKLIGMQSLSTSLPNKDTKLKLTLADQ